MEDSFRVRVDKAFGSLEASSSSDPSSSFSITCNTTKAPSSSSNLTSLWCLTDDEIERREWNRDKGCSDDEDDDRGPVLVSKPCPASKLDSLLAKHQNLPSSSSTLEDLEELLDDSDEEDYGNEYADQENGEKQQSVGSSSRQLEKPEDHNHEEWDIRSSVGLDCTLDFEEEEDAYDQVAIGKVADDFYREDITDYEADMESSSELPKTFRDVRKDPRANHIAAQIRLKEDAEAAADLNEKLEDADDVKSILIKRDSQLVMKLDKRVRFEPGSKGDNDQGSGQPDNMAMEESPTSDTVSFCSQACPGVPDYVRNPSKYTHYMFDSSCDVSEESNQKAYIDFLNFLKGPNSSETQDCFSGYLPKSVTFTPKKKPVDSIMKNDTDLKKDEGDGNKDYARIPLSIAAADAQDSEICAMEEDEPETAADKSIHLPKGGRRYRTKARISLDELVS